VTEASDTTDHEAIGEVAPRGRFSDPRRRRLILIVASVVLLALIGGGLFAALTTGASAGNPLVEQTGAPAPGFSLPELVASNRTVSLADLKGENTVINFWQSSCGPCKTEMPMLQSAYNSAHGKVRFVGIDTTDSRGPAIAFVHSVRVSYLTLFDPQGQVATKYGVYGTPTTIFISANGSVEGRHIGEMSSATLRSSLQEAFHTTVF
jgi:cytochrome c biogenesis protein CcmG, thiol:disulfide interchange protein DsbE